MRGNQPKSMKFIQHLIDPDHLDNFFLKSWGFEYWFENNEKYCGKIINVRMQEWSSFGAFHYHRIKDETFLVLSGTLIVDILDLTNVLSTAIEDKNAIINCTVDEPWVLRFYLKPFDYIRIYPGVLHRFSGFGGESMFTETSTTHNENDSYRIGNPHRDEQMEYVARKVLRVLPYDTSHYSYITKSL